MQKREQYLRNATQNNAQDYKHFPANRKQGPRQATSEFSVLRTDFDEQKHEPKMSLDPNRSKRNRNVNVIKLNSEVNDQSKSSLKVDGTSPQRDKPLSSFVAAFSKTKVHDSNQDVTSETTVMHVESCKLNETGKSAHIVTDYTDHVTRFCKPSSERDAVSAGTDRNLLVKTAISTELKSNDQLQKFKMKMEPNELTVKQRNLPVKSISAVDIKHSDGESNKKNAALVRGRRINTVNLPGDNKNRIQARKMPLRRPRRRKDSSSSQSSLSDDNVSPAREQESPSITNNSTNQSDKINQIMHSPSRVRARTRRRGPSNASDSTKADISSEKTLTADSHINDKTRQTSDRGCLKNETTNGLKCYSVTSTTEASTQPNISTFDSTKPANCHSTECDVLRMSCKPSVVIQADHSGGQMSNTKHHRSFDDDKLIIERGQTSPEKNVDGIDVVKHNNHCSSALEEPTNQNQVLDPPSSKASSSEIERNLLNPTGSENKVVDQEESVELKSANSKAVFGQFKRKQNNAQHTYENVTVLKDGTSQVKQGHLLKAKKVNVSYWPENEATAQLFNVNTVSKAKAVSDLFSIAKDSMIQDTAEKDYLRKLTKETNLSDPIDIPKSDAPLPPRRRNKASRSFQHTPNSRIAVVARSNTDSNSQRVPADLKNESLGQNLDSSLQEVSTERIRFRSRRFSQEKKGAKDPEERLETSPLTNYPESSEDVEKSSPNHSEIQIFATTTVSTRKSSVVSQSTALPTRKPSKRNDSEDSIEVDEGFTEDIQDKAPTFDADSSAFSSGKWRQASHKNIESNPYSSASNRSHNDTTDANVGVHILGSVKTNRSRKEKNNIDQNSDSDLSGCSGSSSVEDEVNKSSQAESSIRPIFDSESSFKVPKKKSFSEPNANAVYTAGLIRRNNLDQGDTTFSYPKRHSSGTTELYGIDENGHALPRSTKTFKAKERKYANAEDFKSSEENVFQPIRQGDVSSDSLSPTDHSSLEDSLEPQEKEFQEMLNTMEPKDRIAHVKSRSKPVQDLLDPDLPRVPARSRRTGVVRTYETNGDITYSGYNEYQQEKKKTDLRKCVVTNLLETEDVYVASLRMLMESYLKPLKQPVNQNVSELQLVDDIIFQVSQFLHNHQQFSASIRERYETWSSESKMGELFVDTFNKDMLLKSYTNYINNFNSTKEVINVAIDTNPAFRVLLEQSQRDSKQGLADLMIKPVQRVPRYELLIKDLLKHTHSGHPDYEDLLTAQKDIHSLAVQMNKGEREAEAADKHTRLLQEIEQLIEQFTEAISIPKRRFIQQEFCIDLKSTSKKDRSLWLFNDMLMGTVVKKGRGSSLRRSTMNLYSLLPDDTTIDTSNKYKYLWKYPLADIEIIRGADKQIQAIREDLKLLADIETVASKISIGHDSLSSLIKEMKESLDLQVQEKQRALSTSTNNLPSSFQPIPVSGCRLEVRALTSFGMKVHQFEFFTEESRQNFERLLVKAKEKFMLQKSQWGPSLLKVIPISKTRNGMQFSCAASNVDTQPGTKEVWVCNTDGHVGQICFLTVESDPQQTQCLTVCNAKICCIAQVPSYNHHKLVPTNSFINAISKTNLEVPSEQRRPSSVNDPAKTIMAFDESDDSDDYNLSPYSTLGSVNSVSSYDLAHVGHEPQMNGSHPANKNNLMHQLLGSGAYKKDNNGSTLHGSLEDLLSDGSSSNASVKKETSGFMWVGTEDGTINVFSTLEPIRTSRYGTQLNHNAAVLCILPYQSQVFVALSNGDLIVYQRDIISGQWDYSNKKCISGASSSTPITKMIVVNENELWCGCQNEVRIINIKTHDLKSFFPVVNDKARQIYCMVVSGYGVWIAMDKNPTIKLFHSVTHDLITEVDVTSSVNSMLAGSDAIIRQHKLACLRVTSLLICKNSLWAGTSAGVLLTVSLPNVTPQSTPLQLEADPQSLGCGHTGHVRFLTEMEVVETTSLPGKGGKKPAGKRRVSASVNQQTRTSTLVVSGGDGFEDFGGYSTNNKAGKEDSTNHLLVWKV